MLIGNIHQLEDYPFLSEAVKRCFSYAKQHNLEACAPGRYEIDGQRLYVKIEEYETEAITGRLWEAHKNYLDVQLLLEGCEQIDINFTEQMNEVEYLPKEDILRIEGEKRMSLILAAGDFAIFFPHDAHRSHMAPDHPQKIKKAVFKVRIEKN